LAIPNHRAGPLQALITFFVELCLLRRAPQDLPASDALLAATLVAKLLIGLVAGVAASLPPGTNLLLGLLEAAIALTALHIALQVTRHLPRFSQAATAVLGSGAVLELVSVLPLAMNATGSEQTDTAALGAILYLGLMGWSIVVTGHILRHTFSITLGQGVAIAVAYEVFSIILLAGLFGTA